MKQLSNIINRNHNPKLKEEVKSEPDFLVDIEAIVSFSKPSESFDYLIRCQNNFKHAICMSAINQPIK